ncbi:carbamate kinase [Fructilactobacillus fructivorans]|uniref:Carbamate kinase n=1 Tax=Fructilactobacillus fructivorans TaxID=1614 RepID=A0A0C1Q3G0_9LACO|nr:carbamate kinase [Fructilactobacillus fructivorans]KID42418.1 Carbamate kinase [Fructilactobacillus fructivorans]MCT0150968.1 carbamate kinase [Fructilactobacillus fructivorans]MCT2867475.1 carbamate kinase [Fructilactobacillus fructivorans]MCT2869007.1 carbamate kinase [Fructilactobacillus fructivorans]MCT2873274.1 carbamate kinase [Fructilactobacillus fructivorans]
MKRVVIALGGNAILTDDPTAKGQEAALKQTTKKIVEFVRNSAENVQLIITHGNGPQVGNLLLQELNGSTEKNPPMPLDVVGAMTQGEMGLWISDALCDNDMTSSTIVTRVLVNPDDPAFKDPTKPIGPFYADVNSILREHPDWKFAEDSGRGFRRVVPSPHPISILEAKQIGTLVDSGFTVIAGGGGGVPVIMTDNGDVEGVEAVIDKDFTASLIGQMVEADQLIILTAIDQAAINFGKPNQRELGHVSLDELDMYLKQHQFGRGSMEPKIQAAMQFVKNTGKDAVITSLDNVAEFEKNGRATVIKK